MAQFLAAGFVVLVVVVIGTVRLSEEAADDESIMDARSTSVLLGRSASAPSRRT